MTAHKFAKGAANSKPNGKTFSKVKKKRISLDFAPLAIQRLNTLKAKTEASSYVEVVTRALCIYEALIEETKGEKKFLVSDQNGMVSVSSFRMFL